MQYFIIVALVLLLNISSTIQQFLNFEFHSCRMYRSDWDTQQSDIFVTGFFSTLASWNEASHMV